VSFGWRGLILLAGATRFLVAAWWCGTRANAREHPRCQAEEIELIEAHRGPVVRAQNPARAWRKVLMQREVLLLTLTIFA